MPVSSGDTEILLAGGKGIKSRESLERELIENAAFESDSTTDFAHRGSGIRQSLLTVFKVFSWKKFWRSMWEEIFSFDDKDVVDEPLDFGHTAFNEAASAHVGAEGLGADGNGKTLFIGRLGDGSRVRARSVIYPPNYQSLEADEEEGEEEKGRRGVGTGIGYSVNEDDTSIEVESYKPFKG